MSQLNSSTSSSESPPLPAPTRPQWGRDLVVIGGFMIATLAALDVAINVLFPSPAKPDEPPSRLAAYFEYGRSIEGKLDRIVGPSDQTAAVIAHAGWLNDPPPRPTSRSSSEPGLLINSYGMSFNEQLGQAVIKIEPTIKFRYFQGPAAAPSCAYAYYLADPGRHDGDVAMLGILASRVAAMQSMSGMNSTFEGPRPYTYPRFLPDDSGGLEIIEPSVRSLGELRTALTEPKRRTAFIDEMRRHDTYYASYLFDRSILDYSAVARMVRRYLAHRQERFVEGLCYTEAGFLEDSTTIKVLRIIVRKFAASVRKGGKLPLVVLFDARGYSGHLYTALAEVIKSDDIPYLSTNSICPSSDPTNYVVDGHFTLEANRKFAEAVIDIIAARLPGRLKPKNARGAVALRQAGS